MATIQYQEKNGCYLTTIPKDVIKTLGAKKGDRIHFNISENGQVQVIKIKEEQK